MYAKMHAYMIVTYWSCVKKSAIKDKIGDISFILLHIDLKILISTQQMQWSFTEKPVNIILAWTAVCSPVLKIS